MPTIAFSALIPPATASLLLLGALYVVAAGVIVRGRKLLEGTTLLAPCHWVLVALAAIFGGELLITISTESTLPGWAAPLRFSVAISSLCPLMAILGAKRPQDRGWQFIVLSFWGVLLLPAGHWYLFGTGREMELFAAWSWFLVLIIGLGVVNYLPTRFWLQSLLLGASEILLFFPYLPLGEVVQLTATVRLLLSAALLCVSLLLIAWGWPEGRKAASPWEQIWIDFRDLFGLAWGLRVAERLRASARMYDWHLEIDWNGFRPNRQNDEIAPAVEQALGKSLRSLLRRFVSPAWIARRLETEQTSGEN